MEVDIKLTYNFCMKHFFTVLTIINVAAVQNFKATRDNSTYSESIHVEIMHKYGLLNCLIINF